MSQLMDAENQIKKKPGLITGAIVGGLLTAPVIAVLYAADQLGGFPFVPFDVFSWVRDRLPGDVITRSIETLSEVIIEFDLGRVDSTAKSVERFSALMMVVTFGIVVAALMYKLASSADRKDGTLLGLVTGVFTGIIMAMISASENFTATVSSAVGTIWILIVFAVWGLVLGWAYDRLIRFEPVLDERPEEADDGEKATVRQLNRREFLVQIGGAAAVITVVGAGVGLMGQDSDEDAEIVQETIAQTTTSVGAEATESATVAEATPIVAAGGLIVAPGTRPEYTPLEDHYQIDIAPRSANIDPDTWQLEVAGLVAEPVSMTLDDLRNNYEPVDRIITLSCISNQIGGTLISTTRWTGIPMRLLVEEWNIDPAATHLKISGGDGFFEYVDLDLIRNDDEVLLAYAWDGQPLKAKHGFPLRIYIPDRYGMKQPKWIIKIEAVEEWDEGYWVKRGWSPQAIVEQTSVVDVVAGDAVYEQDGQTFVPVGGIAYSGARGISKVEVSVDNGDWVEAQLRDPLSDYTWVIWRYDWPFEEGGHTFRVRCVDGAGHPQTEENGNREPDGVRGANTGLDSKREDL
jgi:DMSO/TMAO reductase YedYZ molybdopterin-dependent catalytic subunit